MIQGPLGKYKGGIPQQEQESEARGNSNAEVKLDPISYDTEDYLSDASSEDGDDTDDDGYGQSGDYQCKSSWNDSRYEIKSWKNLFNWKGNAKAAATIVEDFY